MANKFHVTFDIDWAPDSSIELCLEILKSKNVKATFFTTHETDLNSEIERQGHNLGIHPNFLPGSSQGANTHEIITTCLKYAPNATTMRTHALVQSSPMLYQIFKEFPQLKLDASILMHKAKHVERFNWNFDGVSFDRINYNWEDDAEFSNPNFDWSKEFFPGEISIYDFHPIHIHLNSCSNDHYRNLKSSLNGISLMKVERKNLDSFMNTGHGSRTFLQSIVSSDAESISLESIK
ncbi:hypothetical protein ABE458_00535 [Pseudomonas protegens]|uniref:polysaccharide deacetylase WbmS family protein n=1 Tax=Pseudomonas protegens TaxID=380021 RepID=UPI003207906D